jgi:hypothetical protein
MGNLNQGQTPAGTDQRASVSTPAQPAEKRAIPTELNAEFFDVYGKDIARWAVGKVASSLLGDSVGKALSGPLSNAMGIGAVDTAAQYHQEVMQELQQIEGQIREVQLAITDVRNAVTVVGNLVSAEALAGRLQELELQANVVRTHFEMMANDFLALTRSRERAASRDLFARLRSPHDSAVAIAMENMVSIMVTSSAANPGVIERMRTYLRGVMVNYAATPANYQGAPWADGTPDGWRVVMDNPIYFGDMLYAGSFDTATGALPVIGQLFRRILTVQLQGVIYLAAAWKGGPQQPALVALIKRVVQQVALMHDFHRTAGDLITQVALDNLRVYGARPKLRYKAAFVASHDAALPVPLNDDWILWTRTGAQSEQFVILRKPWEQGSILTWLLYRNGSSPTWTWVSDGSSAAQEWGKLKLPAVPANTTQLAPYDRPLPAEFDFLRSLPSMLPEDGETESDAPREPA